MKTKFLFIVILILPLIGFGQNRLNQKVSEVKVTPPVFTGIENVNLLFDRGQTNDISNYLVKNFVYPAMALQCY